MENGDTIGRIATFHYDDSGKRDLCRFESCQSPPSIQRKLGGSLRTGGSGKPGLP